MTPEIRMQNGRNWVLIVFLPMEQEEEIATMEYATPRCLGFICAKSKDRIALNGGAFRRLR